ncbi:hypothetical protein GCM10009527_092130 [Actinomadura nitritigenes]|uniref:Uncharacterized protein n=1 Tax=Actinomadura nitritigenes TaxID=134602 RepID=A0ABS3RE67_9ACTN|nr:hypothetical protein [Actinomadura nitritigenes]MBO2444522.1 hypothetical protein [Actinomadura nitritigenes]
MVPIDAKTRMRPHTGRYAISCTCTCAQAGLPFTDANAPIPHYYVLGDAFSDLAVPTAAAVTAYTTIGHPHPSGAYYLIETHHPRPFETVFGATPRQ